MRSKTQDQWLEAETALGFRSFYALHLRSVKRLTVFHGLAHPLLIHFAEMYQDKGADVIRWHSVHQANTLTGVIVPSEEIAWVSGEVYRPLRLPPTIIIDSIPVGPNVGISPDEVALKLRIKASLQGAFTALSEYSLLHEAASQGGEDQLHQWVQQFLDAPRPAGPASDAHFFGTPLTAQGPQCSFLAEKFRGLETTVHLHGDPSDMNARLIRRFGEIALLRGYPVHFYHDSLSPARIDHVIIPTLRLGFTNASPPHELPGGKHRTTVNPTAKTPPITAEGESWWQTYQRFYTHAWQLMEVLGALRDETTPVDPDALVAIMSRCTA